MKKSISILSKSTREAMRFSTIFLSKSEVYDLMSREGWHSTKENTDLYTMFCCLNTWCNVFQDITGMTGEVLSTRLRLNGVKYVIEEADQTRLELVHEVPVSSAFWKRFVHEVSEQSLTLTGLPRRMRVIGKGSTSEITKFIEGNTKCKYHNLDFLSIECLDSATDALLTFTDYPSLEPGSEEYDVWWKTHTHTPGFLLDEARRLWSVIFKDWKQDTSLFTLPPGVSYEGARTYLEKFRIVKEQQNWLRDHGVNIPVIPTMKFSEPAKRCRYNLVPKTFKSLRGIAPEPVAKQVLGYQIDSGMRRCLKRYGCDLNDQSRNRRMSRALKYATEDMTAASDSISLFLVDTISKDTPQLHDALMAVHAEEVIVDGRCYRNHRFATMGNSVTFVVEAAIFLIMCIITYELQTRRYFADMPKGMFVSFCINELGVYGDDCILPAYLHETFVEVCRMFGFTVNTEKSFAKGLYRESCGAEWYDGQDVTGTYWPRGLSENALAELVSLQHKFVDYPMTNSFLVSLILDVFPDITQSEVGSPYQDIWCASPQLIRTEQKSRYACFYHIHEWWVTVRSKTLRLGERSSKRVKCWSIHSTKPANARFNDPVIGDTWREVLILEESPEDMSPWVLHTTIDSATTGRYGSELREEVEYLAYLLTIGNGIEHVNSSTYTKTEDTILNRRDLIRKRKVKIHNKAYFG